MLRPRDMSATALAVRRPSGVFSRLAHIEDNDSRLSQRGSEFLLHDFEPPVTANYKITGRRGQLDGREPAPRECIDAAVDNKHGGVPEGAQCPGQATILAPTPFGVCEDQHSNTLGNPQSLQALGQESVVAQ